MASEPTTELAYYCEKCDSGYATIDRVCSRCGNPTVDVCRRSAPAAPAAPGEPTCAHTGVFIVNGTARCMDCRQEWPTRAEWERARGSAPVAPLSNAGNQRVPLVTETPASLNSAASGEPSELTQAHVAHLIDAAWPNVLTNPAAAAMCGWLSLTAGALAQRDEARAEVAALREELRHERHALEQAVASSNARDEKWMAGIRDACKPADITFDGLADDVLVMPLPTLHDFIRALRSQAEAGARELMATQKERTALAKQLGAERAAAAVPRSGGSAQ